MKPRATEGALAGAEATLEETLSCGQNHGATARKKEAGRRNTLTSFSPQWWPGLAKYNWKRDNKEPHDAVQKESGPQGTEQKRTENWYGLVSGKQAGHQPLQSEFRLDWEFSFSL